jgi:hypothetical protein
VENRLVKQVSDTFQKLRSKVSALLSTLLQLVQSVREKRLANSLLRSQKTLLKKQRGTDNGD